MTTTDCTCGQVYAPGKPAACWQVLEPTPFTDATGTWPNAVAVHDHFTEAEARTLAAAHGWEVRHHFWRTCAVTVEAR